MFNLENELSKWKVELLEMKSLTKEDVEELESHILDKIYDIKDSGYTLEEAFNIAKNNLGNADLLNDEYIKVNTRIPLQQRIGYGVLGFILISFIFQMQIVIASILISPLTNKVEWQKLIYVPAISNLLKYSIGIQNSSKLTIITFLISTILTVISIYLILSNKNNIITKYIETIEKYKAKNMLNIILLVVIPIGLILMPIVKSFIRDSIYGNIVSINSLMTLVSNLILFIAFTVEISKNNRNNKFKLIALTGHITINLIFESIPIILNLLLLKVGVSNFKLSFIIYVAISLLVIYYLGISNNIVTLKIREFLELSNKRVIVGVLAVIISIASFILTPLYAMNFSANLMGNIYVTIYGVKNISIVILLCITCLYNLISNYRNNVKLSNKKYV